MRHLNVPTTWLLAIMYFGGCDTGPCAEEINIPTDCAVGDDGAPVEDDCYVDGDDAFAHGAQTCGRAEMKYLAELCAVDPSAVTDEVVDGITCDRVDED